METAIGVGGTPADKEFVFQAPPVALEAFRAGGIDVVSAANNHGMDFGVESLEETLAAETASGFPIIGIGRDEVEAYAPFIAEVRGQRIAVIGATQVLDDHLIDEWTAGPAQPGLASAKRVDRLVQAVAEAQCGGRHRRRLPPLGRRARDVPDGEPAGPRPSARRRRRRRRRRRTCPPPPGRRAARRRRRALRARQLLVPDQLRRGRPHRASSLVTVTGRRVDGYEWLPGRVVDHQPTLLEGAERDDELAYWNGLRELHRPDG